MLIGLLNGRFFILALWFQNVLIFTTLLSTIIIFLFKNENVLIFQFLMVLSYRFQYSGENYIFVINHFKGQYKYTFGPFIDTFPHSITGFLIASLKIKNKISIYQIRNRLICIAILIIFSIYDFDSKLLTFRYGGLRLNIASCCIFFIFLLSFEKIKNIKINNFFIISNLSKYKIID